MSVSLFNPNIDKNLVYLTENAVKKVNQLIDEEGNPDLYLRLFINGGGCSGFEYGFAFDEQIEDDDSVFEYDGAKLVVDPLSIQYVLGASVDYTEGLQGSKFTVDNPNATTTCGCGSSFNV